MARAGFWVRGARGKLAGAVLQKGEGGTIMRERVDPRNPQTMEQMKQRIAFGTAASAAKWMLPVIGIGFEGINNPKMGRRMFVKLNTDILKNAMIPDFITSYPHVAFQGKGSSQLVPNPYIVSKGSLVQPSQLQFFNQAPHDEPMQFPEITSKLEMGRSYTASELWQAIYGIKAGQQLTRVAIFTVNGPNVISFGKITEDRGDYMRYSRFYSDRIVLDSGNGENYTIVPETTAADIKACMQSIVNYDATAGSAWKLLEFTGSLDNENDVFKVTVPQNVFVPEFDSDVLSLMAFGCFVSELINNVWRYSTCQLTAKEPGHVTDGDVYYGLASYNAIETYMKNAAAVVSDRYTQQGGDEDYIGDF